MEDMVVAIFAGTQGYLDRVTVERVPEFLERLRGRTHAEQDELLRKVRESGQLSDEDEQQLHGTLKQFVFDFGPDFDEEGQPLEGAEAPTARSASGDGTGLDAAVQSARAAEEEAEEEPEQVRA
jgi:F-type H+-transporting ATPase subunit alpha